jgi:hypothetical protein
MGSRQKPNLLTIVLVGGGKPRSGTPQKFVQMISLLRSGAGRLAAA